MAYLMQAKLIRNDLEIPPGHPGVSEEFFLKNSVPKNVFRNSRTRPVMFWKEGTVFNTPDCFKLVQQGVALPVDDECRDRAGMDPERMAAAQRAYERVLARISAGWVVQTGAEFQPAGGSRRRGGGTRRHAIDRRQRVSEGNGYLSLEQLTKRREVREVDVDCPELGGKVRLRGFTVRQKTAFEQALTGKSVKEGRERLLVQTIVKPEGLTAEHLKLIGDQDSTAWEPLVEAAMTLTGFKEADLEKLSKNSEPTTESDGA